MTTELEIVNEAMDEQHHYEKQFDFKSNLACQSSEIKSNKSSVEISTLGCDEFDIDSCTIIRLFRSAGSDAIVKDGSM